MSTSTDIVCLLMIGVCLQMPLVDEKRTGFFSARFLDCAPFSRFTVLELVINKLMKWRKSGLTRSFLLSRSV